jgi:hypothetical protein
MLAGEQIPQLISVNTFTDQKVMQVWRMETYHAVHGVRRHGWPLVALDCDKWPKLAQNG